MNETTQSKQQKCIPLSFLCNWKKICWMSSTNPWSKLHYPRVVGPEVSGVKGMSP